ncbi:MAG: response regulator [Flavobacteriales bacterium]|nr:response regulator [Flavobacteriales bacterium]
MNKKYRILAVDDNEISNEILVDLFESMDYLVDAVLNAEDAINIFKEDKYDLVILDLQMPIIDGIDLMKLLRQKFKMPPIVALSAYSMLDIYANLKELGFDGVYKNPIDAEMCKIIANDWLKASELK